MPPPIWQLNGTSALVTLLQNRCRRTATLQSRIRIGLRESRFRWYALMLANRERDGTQAQNGLASLDQSGSVAETWCRFKLAIPRCSDTTCGRLPVTMDTGRVALQMTNRPMPERYYASLGTVPGRCAQLANAGMFVHAWRVAPASTAASVLANSHTNLGGRSFGYNL
jgi:hypothetical protein